MGGMKGKRICIRFHHALLSLLIVVILIPCYVCVAVLFRMLEHDATKDFLDSHQKVMYQAAHVLNSTVDSINASTAYIFLNQEVINWMRDANSKEDSLRIPAKTALHKFLKSV